jgi:hypothetical protein
MTHAGHNPNRLSRAFLMVLAVGLLVACGVSTPVSAAVTYEVDRFNDVASANACTGAANDCSLRGAISKANYNGQFTTIVLPDGTYQLTIAGADEDYNQTGDLDIREALEITAAPGASPVIEQTETDRVFETHSDNGDFTIRGPMTITGGSLPSMPSENGGLICASRSGSLTLEDVVLVGGQAAGQGGCLSFANPTNPGSLSLTNVTISGCSAGTYGGGLKAEVGDSSAIFDRLTVENNTAEGFGGGVMLNSSSTTVLFIDSTIQYNVSEDPDTGHGFGGGIYLYASQARFERSTVARNRAGTATGANGFGGGLHIGRDSIVTLRNSTVSGNVAEGDLVTGTAVYLDGSDGFSTLLAEQSTIVGVPTSSILETAVGISSIGSITFEGSIVEGGCYSTGGTFTSNGFNVEHPLDGSVTTQCGLTNPSDVLVSSPLLKPLAGYGGPTETHALFLGTVASLLVPSTYCQTTDQRLAPRGLLFCDAGSFESSGEPPGIWIFSDGFESGNTAAW